MANSPEGDPWISDDVLGAIYYLEYLCAQAGLREGIHPDAVRLSLLLALEQDPPAARPEVVEAQWRGLEDALAGRPPASQSACRSDRGRNWRFDAGRSA